MGVEQFDVLAVFSDFKEVLRVYGCGGSPSGLRAFPGNVVEHCLRQSEHVQKSLGSKQTRFRRLRDGI